MVCLLVGGEVGVFRRLSICTRVGTGVGIVSVVTRCVSSG